MLARDHFTAPNRSAYLREQREHLAKRRASRFRALMHLAFGLLCCLFSALASFGIPYLSGLPLLMQLTVVVPIVFGYFVGCIFLFIAGCPR